nr:Notch [Cucujiformia]
FSGNDCNSNPCLNNGSCRLSDGGGYICDCPPGTNGTNCEIDSLNECNSNPCQHPKAVCQDKLGGYICYCPKKHKGKNCEIYDERFPGGPDLSINPLDDMDSYFAKDLEKQRQECLELKCPLKRGNHRCDEECNKYACDFDGNDCSLGINPWANCTAPIRCWEVFDDKKCNEDCNNAECLFDGGDCRTTLQPCNPIYDAYCQKHYANGHCDYGCNNAECCDEECNKYACDFDGNDCSLGINPWANCTAPIRCWEVFDDKKCNEDCNNAECLFDGGDC